MRKIESKIMRENMQLSNIPYEDRVLSLPSGFVLIWPFRNKPMGDGPYELFLDNNALINTGWFSNLEPSYRSKVVISPMLALAEQWLSNQDFRSEAKRRIEKFIAPFIKAGIRFPEGYATAQAGSLAKNEMGWRTQWMLVYLYVVLLYRITKARKGDVVPEKLLFELKHQNVPMFNGCLMLCCLASYLRSHQSVRLIDDDNTAYSYLNSFVSLHGQSKGESEFDENYVRNRAGDLAAWTSIGSLYQNGFRPAGEPVIVTRDKALSKLIFRCFPGYLDSSGKMAFSFDERAFEPQHAVAIVERINAAVGPYRPPTSREEQLKRMEILRVYVTEGADTQLVTAVNQIWDDWLNPGYHVSFQ